MVDLATFGETMLRLSPPGDAPVEVAPSFDVHAAGAESNVAVAAGRLGLDAVWLSKLPDSPPGRRVTSAIRGHGVETAVTHGDGGRQGTYYLERADEPRGTAVHYDRSNTAVRTATPDELATDRIEAATAFHTSGITPALSPTLERTTADLLDIARGAGTTTTFDVNYRSKLWSPTDARETLSDLLPAIDVCVVAERDAETVLEVSGTPEAIARSLADEFGFETTIVTRGADGAVALRDDELVEQDAFRTGDSHPIGSGDAFVGGYLAKRLHGGRVAESLAYGAATASLKRTIPGDLAVVTPADVERVLDEGSADLTR